MCIYIYTYTFLQECKIDDKLQLEEYTLNWTIGEFNCSNLDIKSIYWSSFSYGKSNEDKNTDLKILDISHNNIKTFIVKTFSMLEKLEFLYLNHNVLISVDPSYFYGLINLKALFLQNNMIKYIENHTFVHLSLLKKLNIDNNNMTDISKPAFKGLAKLEVLELRYNQIAILNAETFIYLENLKSLDIGYNNIKIISNSHFSQLKELVILKLDYNMIRELEHNNETLISLQTLYINNNFIKSIDNYIIIGFEQLPRLTFINISYNFITMIKEVNFTFPGYVNEIILSNNPLNCLCELAMKGDAYISKHLDFSEDKCHFNKKKKYDFLNCEVFVKGNCIINGNGRPSFCRKKKSKKG